MKHFLLFILFAFSFSGIKAQFPLTFPSEYIDFKLDSNYFSVNGIYTFKNVTDQIVNNPIKFPFAVPISMIDSIRIFELNSMSLIPFKKLEQAILFNVSVSPFDSIEINIYYQQLISQKNTYILTTTSSWGAPIKQAVYTLLVNKGINIKSLSIEHDSMKHDLKGTTYYWNRFNFEPQTDFEVIIE